MFPSDRFPPSTQLSAVLIVFIGALAVFHVAFVFLPSRLTLGKTGWKIVDYFWLGFTALGLIGSVAQARQEVAQSRLALSESRVDVMYEPVLSLAHDYGKDGGYVCRTFVRSQDSPPQVEMDRAQRDFNATCEWFKKVVQSLPPRGNHEVVAEVIPPDPSVMESDLRNILGEFRKQVGYYNERAKDHAMLVTAAKRSEAESSLVLLSPLLLALALALRITKVTGEIRLT